MKSHIYLIKNLNVKKRNNKYNVFCFSAVCKRNYRKKESDAKMQRRDKKTKLNAKIISRAQENKKHSYFISLHKTKRTKFC